MTSGTLEAEETLVEEPSLLRTVKRISEPRCKVLVVDDFVHDSVALADVLATLLNRAGFEAVSCYEHSRAVERAHTFRPHILISDVVHPGENGIETARAIQVFLPKCKVLLISASALSPGLLQAARARGYGQDFTLLRKPVQPEAFLAWMQSVGKRPEEL